MAYNKQRWTELLPTAMMRLRSVFKPDLPAAFDDLVFANTIRLSGDLLDQMDTNLFTNTPDATFVENLK